MLWFVCLCVFCDDLMYAVLFWFVLFVVVLIALAWFVYVFRYALLRVVLTCFVMLCVC